MEYVLEFQIKIYFLNLSIITNLVNVLLCFVTPPTISSSAHCINSVAKPLQPPFSSDFTSGAYKNNYKRQNESILLPRSAYLVKMKAILAVMNTT